MLLCICLLWGRRAYCGHADALFPPVWLALMAAAVHSQALPLWQLLLLGAVSFWVGLYVMAVRWAGVPSKRLSMSRVAPALVVCLELLCGGEEQCWWSVQLLVLCCVMWLCSYPAVNSWDME